MRVATVFTGVTACAAAFLPAVTVLASAKPLPRPEPKTPAHTVQLNAVVKPCAGGITGWYRIYTQNSCAVFRGSAVFSKYPESIFFASQVHISGFSGDTFQW